MCQQAEEGNQWHKQLGLKLDSEWRKFKKRSYRCFTSAEAVIANLPLTIGAVAMAVVTFGAVCFKFAEANLASCEPVHFHPSQ
jgi:hypothetical protein